ncbi:MAG: zinc ribbon domain-containing protein [Candidatus Caldarchaeum sp.]
MRGPMAYLARIAAAALTSFAIVFLASIFEFSFPQPLQIVVVSLVLAAVATGFVAGSPVKAAAATFAGGVGALVLSILWGVKLWSPSPVPSDTPIIRTLLVCGTAVLAAGVGYLAAGLLQKSRAATEQWKEQPASAKAEAPTQSEPTSMESMAAIDSFEAENRICKFCGSVIPAESVFCPMCGAKLVERE